MHADVPSHVHVHVYVCACTVDVLEHLLYMFTYFAPVHVHGLVRVHTHVHINVPVHSHVHVLAYVDTYTVPKDA
jgi:hypothetical protein